MLNDQSFNRIMQLIVQQDRDLYAMNLHLSRQVNERVDRLNDRLLEVTRISNESSNALHAINSESMSNLHRHILENVQTITALQVQVNILSTVVMILILKMIWDYYDVF